MKKARYIMVGGFLGAGKTTAIAKFAGFLHDRGLKVGLITNDQGAGLVDSALARSHRFPVEEIAGGCFCCRFSSLVDAARELTKSTRPDVFIAEPVGSCTDLVATVSLPMRMIYGDDYAVAPLSVLVDPIRALAILGVEEGKRFSENVRYIYGKQLEEAEIIVINKIDLLDDAREKRLRAALAEAYPHAEIVAVSAREGTRLEDWFERVRQAEMRVSRFMDVDYERYGDGEALLGWLNCMLALESGDGAEEFDGNALLMDLAEALRGRLAAEDAEVAHLKMTLNPAGEPFEMGAVNLVRSEDGPELSHRLVDPLEGGDLIVNMRCEADPAILDAATTGAFAEVLAERYGLHYRETHREHFRPAPPKPEHRLSGI